MRACRLSQGRGKDRASVDLHEEEAIASGSPNPDPERDLRTGLGFETDLELKPVWDLKPVWVGFYGSGRILDPIDGGGIARPSTCTKRRPSPQVLQTIHPIIPNRIPFGIRRT